MTDQGTFKGSLIHALNSPDPHEIISGVKSVIAEELHNLDDRVDVEFTSYFNHSYMPDMVLTWREGGKRKERPLFVRTGVDPGAIAADLHGLVPQSPLVIGVDELSSGHVARRALDDEQSRRRVDLLMTDADSIAALSPAGDKRSSGYDFSKLVGGNFLSGGRGFVGEDEANLLIEAVQMNDGQSVLPDFETTVDRFFMEDAALRLKRSTSLVQQVLSGNLNDLALSGRFSHAELRTVLPLLLSNPLARETSRLWSELGEVMGLTDLFEIASDLESLDVSPLLSANADRWTAKRSQVVMAVADPENDNSSDGEESVAEPVWALWRGLLTLNVKDWKVLFADDARKLKGRGSDGTVPQWIDISNVLPSFDVKAVNLNGLARRVSISAEQSGDIYDDIATVTRALDESFYVPRIDLATTQGEKTNHSSVEFSEMLVTSSPSETLANHTSMALNLLLHGKRVAIDSLPNSLVEHIRLEPPLIS
ncbi:MULTISPECIES: hypothetical protein [unclassified Arthrobacter]|uniref:hypothetical protein n=1 Tax=unclassified Arthrobacter TaxID=235627 RepID=UPI00149297F1|nr:MULTISPECIES: hypothetical protein [unclassified Arthrobacter]MBE0009587.1 hypothetical protein [Arthrobacter sp. AET 35A]NOJ63337.1 hypothetical protein [Arthrobacter sp. 147(2020)]